MINVLLLFILLLELQPTGGQIINNAKNNLEKSFYETLADQNNIKPTPKNEQNVVNIEPHKSDTQSAALAAKGYYSIDLKTNKVLEEKNQNEKLQVASLTKLMTAYVILREEENLDKVVVVPDFKRDYGDAVMGLRVGEQITVRSLLYGLLINSGADAAETLATTSSGTREAFMAKMNDYARRLDLKNTNFTNPVGWDDKENYSSAKDIANLSRVLLGNPFFSEAVSMKTHTVTGTTGEVHNLVNTNRLLSDGFSGIKTGYTTGAGECLASLYKQNDKEILTVVIGSPARFYETNRLKDWILRHFLW